MTKPVYVLVALACAALSACGGGGSSDDGDGGAAPPPPPAATYSVGGDVTGVAGTGVTLRINGHSDLVVTKDGAFTFADRLSTGATYKVSVAAQPATPKETCVISNADGTVAQRNVTDVKVTCAENSYSLGGTVSGLTGTVMLQSPGMPATEISSNGDFVLGTPVATGTTYNVTIAAQPANQTCSVSNGSGTVNDNNVANVAITCVTDVRRISAAVIGLVGSGLVLQNNGANNLSITANGTFAFSSSINSGASYNVTVLTQPSAPAQTCTVVNGTGTAGNADISNIQITCATNTHTLGGTVTGLLGSGLVLQNGGATVNVPSNGSFTFSTPLASGSNYTVSVSSQPTGPSQTCTVTNASGAIGNSNVTDVAVTCANNDTTPPTVSTTNPLATASGAGIQLAITATFSEALSAASVSVSSFMLTGPTGAISGTVSLSGGNVASFTPSSPLSFATTYQARLTTAIRDISNNALASDVVWSFNTGKKLSLGAEYGCARLSNGQLKCWGSNSDGQLGLGSTANRGDAAGEMGTALPTVNLGAGRTAVEVAAGGYHVCARLDNHQVKCWGQNVYGQLGLGNTTARGDNSGEMGDSLSAVNLGTGAIAVQLAAGRYFTCARLTTGRVKCWGRNDRGQLGVGDVSSRGDQSGEMGDALATVNLGTGRTAIDIVSQAYHVCARLDDLSVKCWGENIYGQLGLGDVDSRGDAPGEMGDALANLEPGTGHTITQLATNSGHTCAILENGSVKCWGHNLYGQLGLEDMDYRGDDPAEIGDGVPTVNFGTGRRALDVVTGSRQTCVRLDTRAVKCWGWNDFGQLGLGDLETRGDAPGEMGDALPTVNLGTGRTVIELESGSFFECARLDNDEIKCWGNNGEGQLGLGDVNYRGDAAGEMGDSLPNIDLGD